MYLYIYILYIVYRYIGQTKINATKKKNHNHNIRKFLIVTGFLFLLLQDINFYWEFYQRIQNKCKFILRIMLFRHPLLVKKISTFFIYISSVQYLWFGFIPLISCCVVLPVLLCCLCCCIGFYFAFSHAILLYNV